MDLHFRNAVAADIPAIVALVESAYRGEVSRAGWTTEADFLDGQRIDAEGVAADIGKTGSVIVLAEQDGQLLACCHLENTGEVCYFGMFSVAPHLQGGGIGKQLMQEAERVALAWQCTAMEMTVIDIRDELIAFYERRGYARTGIKKPFPYGDARFGLPLRDDLRDAKDYYADKAKAAAESVGDVINRAADAFRDAFKTAASAVTMGDDVPPPPPPASPPPPPAPEPPVGV